MCGQKDDGNGRARKTEKELLGAVGEGMRVVGVSKEMALGAGHWAERYGRRLWWPHERKRSCTSIFPVQTTHISQNWASEMLSNSLPTSFSII